ncbi:MAG: hypothetical protein FJ030_02045 [Chloroflexi bacterium]|nr:hypothetical protein [Chloroflexota bacterium]
MAASPIGSFPSQVGAAQLVWLIRAAAEGEISPQDFVKSFRDVHEVNEAAGRIRYDSREQARLVWDVLWELEYYSPDPSKEENPEDWNSLETVMKTVKRSAAKLAELQK